jgi:ribosomal protein S27E
MATTIKSLTELKRALQPGAVVTMTANKAHPDDARIGEPRTVVRADDNKVTLRRARPDGSHVTSDLPWPEANKIRFTQDGFTIVGVTYRIDKRAGMSGASPKSDKPASPKSDKPASPKSDKPASPPASDNPLGLGLVLVGAAAMAIAVFLPLVEPINTFRRVGENTLIQHGGWMLIALALGIAASGYRASRGTRTWWLPVLLCGIAAALLVFTAADKSTRTLYPVGPDGNPITTQPGMVADLGIAIYVAGAGVAAAFIGSLMLRRSAKQRVPADASDGRGLAAAKKCPDCAETVLSDARVCKHCGYRFAPNAPAAQQELAPGTFTKVRCHHCQHVQMVPISLSTFVCEECNAKLKRHTG